MMIKARCSLLAAALAVASTSVTGFVPHQQIRSSSPSLHMNLRFFQDNKEKTIETTTVSNDRPTMNFDPFRMNSNNGDLTTTTASSLSNKIINNANGDQVVMDDEEEPKIGIWSARALLLLIAVIWGTNFASVKYLETLCFHPPCVHPPSEAAFARFGLAAAVSVPLLIGQRKDIILAGLECGLWISLGYISQAAALSTISSGSCAFICSLTVVVVPLISAILYGKPIKPMNLVAAAVALSGVGILEGMVDTNALLGIAPAVAMDASTASAAIASSSVETANAAIAATGPLATAARSIGVNTGDIIALGQPFGFGFAFIQIEHYVEKFKDEKNRVLTLSAAQCISVGLISLLWVLHDFHGTIPNMGYMLDPHRLAAVAWTGIVTTVFAIYLEGIALQTASATDASLTFASEPVWASLFGVWLLNERLDANAYAGGSIILMACVIGALSDLNLGGEDDNEISVE